MRFTLILALILIPVSISCGDFRPDPVYEHIEKHGKGIDMTGLWSKGKTNYQLKKKNFKPRGR